MRSGAVRSVSQRVLASFLANILWRTLKEAVERNPAYIVNQVKLIHRHLGMTQENWRMLPIYRFG
jgi:hypothetical protein